MKEHASSSDIRPLAIRLLAIAIGIAATTTHGAAPNTLYWEGEYLAAIRSGDIQSAQVQTARTELRRQARIAKRHGPYSIVDASDLPQGGDRHDYVSYGRYWWPSPHSDDGLPYVRKDGIVNRVLVEEGDREVLALLCHDVEMLSLAAYLERDREAARHATELLRVWFLDPLSRMNPRIEYGQLIPGLGTGRPEGILDARGLLGVIDSIALLESAGELDRGQSDQLRQWFNQYADWLATSPLASRARKKRNNHGSWFAAQEAGVALYLGRSDDAKEVVQRVCEQRIADSIEPDGKQPLEVRRTQSLSYSLFNLEALVHVARIGDRVGINVWTYTTSEGASLKHAFEYVAPHLTQQKGWPHKTLNPFLLEENTEAVLILASQRLGNRELQNAAVQCREQAAMTSLASLKFPEIDN